MSTEPTGSAGAGRRFTRGLLGVCGVLAIVSAALIAVNLTQGMRLQATVPDAERLVSAAHEQLVVTSNQQLEPVDAAQVSITPDTPVTVSSTANRITVSFDTALSYSTNYSITISGVTGSFDSTPRSLNYRVETPAPLTVGLRHSDDGDSIVRSDPRTGEEHSEVLFDAEQIDDFAVYAGTVAVSTRSAAGTSELFLIDIDTRNQREITLPGDGVISQLDAAARYNRVGFRYSGPMGGSGTVVDNVLFTFTGNTTPRPVQGIDGNDLRVESWEFVPGKPALIAQDSDTNVYLVVQREDQSIVPLGQYLGIGTVGNDGASVVVSTELDMALLDLTTGLSASIAIGPLDGVTTYPSDAYRLLDGSGVVTMFSVPDALTQSLTQRVVLRTAAGDRVLFDSVASSTVVVGVTSSPNDEYLAVQLIEYGAAEAGNPDGATFGTVIVETATGDLVARLDGEQLQWEARG